jgi:hypothetical protein
MGRLSHAVMVEIKAPGRSAAFQQAVVSPGEKVRRREFQGVGRIMWPPYAPPSSSLSGAPGFVSNFRQEIVASRIYHNRDIPRSILLSHSPMLYKQVSYISSISFDRNILLDVNT